MPCKYCKKIIEGLADAKPFRNHRKTWVGKNVLLLTRIKPRADGTPVCVYDIPHSRKRGLEITACRMGIKVRTLQIAKGRYAVWRVT